MGRVEGITGIGGMGMGKAAEWGHARSSQQSPWDPQLQEVLPGRSRGHEWKTATTASSGSREGGTEEQSCRPLQDAQWTLEVEDGLTQPLEAMLSKDRAGQRRGECSRATGPSPHLQQRGHPDKPCYVAGKPSGRKDLRRHPVSPTCFGLGFAEG